MSWHGIQSHDEIVDRFRIAIERNRLASTFLFVGPGGIGKRAFALKLAAALLCETSPETDFNPCGTCPACQQVNSGSHPDLELVAKPKNKSAIPIELFIGDREHRRREGLCHNIGLKPFRGGRKIAIIDDADYLNQEGANCLLKTLEEPPPRSVLILIGTSVQKQLPTIRSRCQIVRFQPLPDEVLADLILSQQLVENHDQAATLAQLSHGSLEAAAKLVDPEIREFRAALFEQLSLIDVSQNGFPKQLTSFCEAAGKEATKRRVRLEAVVDMAVEFYRELVRSLAGQSPGSDSDLTRAILRTREDWMGDVEQAVDCLQRCIEAHSEIRGNANLTTLIECWLDDLSQIGLGRSASVA
jgi:DNA polymerase-3 subunit delta'